MINKLISKTQVRLLEYDGNPSQDFKADYENRLKADMAAMLDKIKAEIEFEVDHRTNMLCAEDVFAILDKYKS